MAISTGFHTYLNTLSNGRFNRKCCCLQAKPEFAVTSACAPACGWELYKVHPSLPLHATVSRHHAGRTPADFPLSCHVFSPSQGTASNACPWCASLQGFKGNFAPSIVDSAQMPAVTSFFKPLGIQTGASSFVQRFSSPVCFQCVAFVARVQGMLLLQGKSCSRSHSGTQHNPAPPRFREPTRCYATAGGYFQWRQQAKDGANATLDSHFSSARLHAARPPQQAA